MVDAQALAYWLALTTRGDSGATVAGLRGVTRSLLNGLSVAPELPELKKYVNALQNLRPLFLSTSRGAA